MGRLRLPTPERKLRKRESQERWKQKNYEYYTEQTRVLTNRPEYKAIRKERYFTRKAEVRRQILATLMGLPNGQDLDLTQPLIFSAVPSQVRTPSSSERKSLDT